MKVLIFIFSMVFSSGFSYAIRGNELAVVADEANKAEVAFNEHEDFSKGKRNFIATNEWQEVKEDQMIPPGLHIRLNMKTGKKEAKLMEQDNNNNENSSNSNKVEMPKQADSLENVMKEAIEGAMEELEHEASHKNGNGDDDDFQYWKVNGQKGVLRERSNNFTREELKKALKKFKQTDKETSKEQQGDVRFKSMKEIKRQFKDLNLAIKSDSEIIRDSIESLRKLQLQWNKLRHQGGSADEQESCFHDKLTLLTDLEYYLHQIDNSHVLVDNGGLELMWVEMEEEDGGVGGDEVKLAVMLNIAALSQSNPHSQVALVKTPIIGGLLNIIINNATSSSSSSFSPLQAASLSALSAAIRGFPLAQQLVAKQQGFSKIVALVSQRLNNLINNNNNNINNNINNNNKRELKSFIKFSKRFVNLITDIWQEKLFNARDEQLDNNLKRMKAEQYERVGLQHQLASSGWCQLIGRLFTDVTDLDFREAVLKAMQAFKGACPTYQSAVNQQLLSFQSHLQQLISDDDDDSFYKDLYASVHDVINTTTHSDL